ncbi:MAG: hypothetical protein QM820_37645 [Minicystis sp.]
MVDPSAFRYQPFYCEENVYHLSAEPIVAARPRDVVFISNPTRSTAMWNQRAAGRPNQPMVWDYHVVLLVADPWEFWDLDTFLGCPVPAADYLAGSFAARVPIRFRPLFRLVDAALFAGTFASDRTHMVRRGRYERPPPSWPCIGVPDREPNLMRFADMTDPFLGEILDLAALQARVTAG